MLEVPAPANGVMGEIKVQAGTTVTSGQLLASIEEGAAAPRPRRAAAQGGARRREAAAKPPATDGGEEKLSPSVRRLSRRTGSIPAAHRRRAAVTGA